MPKAVRKKKPPSLVTIQDREDKLRTMQYKVQITASKLNDLVTDLRKLVVEFDALLPLPKDDIPF